MLVSLLCNLFTPHLFANFFFNFSLSDHFSRYNFYLSIPSYNDDFFRLSLAMLQIYLSRCFRSCCCFLFSFAATLISSLLLSEQELLFDAYLLPNSCTTHQRNVKKKTTITKQITTPKKPAVSSHSRLVVRSSWIFGWASRPVRSAIYISGKRLHDLANARITISTPELQRLPCFAPNFVLAHCILFFKLKNEKYILHQSTGRDFPLHCFVGVTGNGEQPSVWEIKSTKRKFCCLKTFRNVELLL